MGQQLTTLIDLRNAVLSHEEMAIEIFLETMIDEKLIDVKNILNPNLIGEDGEILLDIDKSRDEYAPIICPFHDTDHNGSGRLNMEENYYKCFNGSCVANKPLNAIDLYMVLKLGVDPKLLETKEVTKKEFPQAVRELAQMLGIPFENQKSKLSEEQKRYYRMITIREKFAKIYHTAYLNHKHRQKVVDYMLHQRGFEHGLVPFEELVTRFMIGFAPGWSYGYDRLKKEFTDEEMIEAGVIRRVTNKQTNKTEIRDFLGGGVVLPYYSGKRINNLYARSLFAKDKRFRHLRLKGNVDIPIHFDAVKGFEEIIIVEGELSWLSLIAMGFENTIGNRGTNGLSDEHVEIMKNIRDKTEGEKFSTIYLCFDPDDAGQGAIVKSGKKLLDAGFDVRVIRLTNGDPNDFLQFHKEEATKEFNKLKKAAFSYEAFMVGHLFANSSIYNEADLGAVLKKVDHFVKQSPKAQLMVLASEVVKYLEKHASKEVSSLLTKEELQFAWTGYRPATPAVAPSVKILPNIGMEKALEHTWLFITDKEDRFKALNENPNLTNVVFVQHMESFLSELTKQNHIRNLLFDDHMTDKHKDMLFASLTNFKFKTFKGTSLEEMKAASGEEIFDMVESFDLSSLAV